MKNLYTYLFEGGASGHMAHPFDYTEFTLRDLKGLIRNLFTGKVEDITEKVDGVNIQATVNIKDEVVFIRNKGNLNSEQGGMTIQDMASKWAANPRIAKTFVSAGETITKVFSNIPNDFFNPKPGVKVVVNCECVIAGKTNIIPYASAQVDFHNLWIYKKKDGVWEQDKVTKDGLDVIERACEKVDGAQITPQLIISIVDESSKLLVDYIKRLDKIFKDAKMSEYSTIQEWKKERFEMLAPDWITNERDGFELLFKRWFDNDKSTNIKIIKEIYKDHEEDLIELDKKGYKRLLGECMGPLDNFFLDLGNKIIDLCRGIINQGVEDKVVKELRDDIEDVVQSVRSEGSVENNEKLTIQLNRLKELGDQINPVEGIVFKYRGKIMKMVGSFSPLNQAINIKYMDMKK